MSDLRIKTGVSSPTRVTSDGQWINARGSRSGALYTADWLQAMAMEGRMFVANAGTITTPITFGAGSIDSTEPDLHLAVADGTTAFLVSLDIVVEAYGSTAIFEFMAAIGEGGTAGADTATVPTNLRTDAPVSTTSVVGNASAADAVYMTTNISEFWRGGLAKAVTIGTADDDSSIQKETYHWSARESGKYPILVGAAQLQVHCAAQASTGFITAVWVEVPSNSIV